MIRIVSLVFCIGIAAHMMGQNQSNPFDLKFRRPHIRLEATPKVPDTIIQKNPGTPKHEISSTFNTPAPQIDSSLLNAADTTPRIKGSNPFELQKGGTKEPEKISSGTSEVQFHNNPSVIPALPVSRHMSKGIQIFFILLSLLFLIFIVNVERNFVKDLWRVISNENYSSLHLRNQRNTMRQILLMMGYVIFFMQAGIFLCHVLVLFGYSGRFLISIWVCIGFVVIIYAVRHLVIRYLRWLFNNEKEMSLFGFDISTFNIMVGLVLLPINVLLNFGPDSLAKPLIIIGLIVIIVAYLMRQLRWMLTARRLIANSLFLFFVYLCTVEILPLWAILKFFW